MYRCQLYDAERNVVAVLYTKVDTIVISYNNKIYILSLEQSSYKRYYDEITPTTEYETTWKA